MDNQTANQTQNQPALIASGFELLAWAVVSTLEQLPAAGLPAEDLQEAEAAAREVLVEVTESEPDQGKMRRVVSALKGYLAPIALGAVTGAAEGSAQEWAKTAIEQLGAALYRSRAWLTT